MSEYQHQKVVELRTNQEPVFRQPCDILDKITGTWIQQSINDQKKIIASYEENA